MYELHRVMTQMWDTLHAHEPHGTAIITTPYIDIANVLTVLIIFSVSSVCSTVVHSILHV